MKKMQKGFSLVELLVVVAIIGVLAGVGIVGYSSYTDSAKKRVSLANFNSVKRFIETELTLLNNNIQTTSGAINSFLTSCTLSVTKYDSTSASKDLGKFLNGTVCYFDTTGYGNVFKNPFSPAGVSQVMFNQPVVAGTTPIKGTINIAILTAGSIGGHTIVDDDGDAATTELDQVQALTDTKGWFQVQYFPEDGVMGTTSEEKAGMFELK